MPRKVLPVFALLFLFFAATTSAFAQETPPEEPDGPAVTVPDEVQAEIEAGTKARYDDFLSRSIFDFRVVYLIKNDLTLEDNSLISGANIAALSGAVQVNSWDEFTELNANQPFHIVFVHQSMVGEIDLEWTRAAYRSGVIIVGINIGLTELAEIVDDSCITKQNEVNFVNQDFFIYFTYVVQTTEAQALSGIHAAELETCSEVETTAAAEIIHGATASFIESSSDLQDLVTALVVDTVNYGMPNLRNSNVLPLPQN